MEEFDLDSFIASVEQSAPPELADKKNICRECETVLEEIEGKFICPNCGAQDTSILELADAEINEGGAGRTGQKVCLRKSSGYITDYGWAWSTDEAIVHILNLQITALTRIFKLPDLYRVGVKNMWFKYWLEYIGPYIKDEYNEADFTSIEENHSLKLRDIEVLIRVQDKVLLPRRMIKQDNYKRNYKMFDVRFRKKPRKEIDSIDIKSTLCETSFLNTSMESVNTSGVGSPNKDEYFEKEHATLDPIVLSANKLGLGSVKTTSFDMPHDISQGQSPLSQTELSDLGLSCDDNKCSTPLSTKNLSVSNITILTLNRTLAFLESTARIMDLHFPLFASDLIRACNQLQIPFLAAHKALPEGMNINDRDRFTFQKVRPPSALMLGRSSAYLLYKVFHDELPFSLPVPNFQRVIARFVQDLNLPQDMLPLLSNQIDFSNFQQIRNPRYYAEMKCVTYIPQYDRWAFVILICQLKRLFGLDKESLGQQRQEVQRRQQQGDSQALFICQDWLNQLSMRLNIALKYDPFALHHPMTSATYLEPTNQMFNYIEQMISSRPVCKTKKTATELQHDEVFRADFSDFLIRQIPRPPSVDPYTKGDTRLDKPGDIRYPLTEAVKRTEKHWMEDARNSPEVVKLMSKDFCSDTVVLTENVQNWTIYDGLKAIPTKPEINPSWPYYFKVLMAVGGYLCYCETKDLMGELRWVEEAIWPEVRIIRKRIRMVKNSERL